MSDETIITAKEIEIVEKVEEKNEEVVEKVDEKNEEVVEKIEAVKKCFLSPNNGFLRFCQGKTQIPIKNYILNSTNRITTVLCQKCVAQQAHIIRASTLHPSSTILLLSYIFLCEQTIFKNYIFIVFT